ncbi:nuclear transport factor 2 family protein [Limobrevibacterium gyesilva]|uniref:Nuclear transport factor 2 family protein n=1 Tax=Limobrevibacterium gyesilva TaxID=2991712 RepID=A0AA41YNQ8_9PROT|nr:nuclear transport factor 2 family protein [Limobrevibacterium gyesilva]MCW3473695.1 nuclear transport factor 2 family protein [Limobrevibacterium gyesilva]
MRLAAFPQPDREAARPALIDLNFVSVNASGTILDKASYIVNYCALGKVVFSSQEVTERPVRRFTGFAVAAMIVHDTFVAAEQTVARPYRSLWVFGSPDARWQRAAGQTMASA